MSDDSKALQLLQEFFKAFETDAYASNWIIDQVLFAKYDIQYLNEQCLIIKFSVAENVSKERGTTTSATSTVDNYCNVQDLDDSCCQYQTDGASQRHLSGELHILSHPVYHVIVPYIRVWDRSGNLLDVTEVQDLIDLNSTNSHTDNSDSLVDQDHHELIQDERFVENECKVDGVYTGNGDMNSRNGTTYRRDEYDARSYEFGRLMPENHPILDVPYLTIHVCTLESKLDDIMRGQSAELYALNWLSLVGPHIGIRMSSRLYKSLMMSSGLI